MKVVDPVDAADIDQTENTDDQGQSILNERKGYIHGLKKSNCLCNTLLYHLPNIGMSC